MDKLRFPSSFKTARFVPKSAPRSIEWFEIDLRRLAADSGHQSLAYPVLRFSLSGNPRCLKDKTSSAKHAAYQ